VILAVATLQLVTFIAPYESSYPMSYDLFGPFWKFWNLISRPDVVLTLMTGSRLPATVCFTVALVMITCFAFGLVKWRYYYPKTHRGYYNRWIRALKYANQIIGTGFFYLLYLPAILHNAPGMACYYTYSWCDDVSLADTILSWINFLGYSVSHYFYMMYTT
jgi:hypothetical protein